MMDYMNKPEYIDWPEEAWVRNRLSIQQQFEDWAEQNRKWYKQAKEAQATADRRLELLVRAMNALEGWRILLMFPPTDIMKDIEKELETEAQKQADEYIESEGAHHSPSDFSDE